MHTLRERFTLKKFLLLHLGVLIVAIGVVFFKYPNHFAMGGVSGLSVVLGALIPQLSPGAVATITNVLLIVIAAFVLGKELAFTTTYASLLLSGLIMVLERAFPMSHPLTDEPLLELFFAILLSAFGAAVLFNMQTSTGGTDILALIIRKYMHMDIGIALLLSDIVIGAATFFIFDTKTGLLSITGLLLKGVIVDSLIESFNRVKYFTIITKNPEPIGDLITKKLKRGATRIEAEGEFTKEPATVFLTVMKRYEAVQLRDAVKRIDPKAFCMITNTSEIIGRGFHSGF